MTKKDWLARCSTVYDLGLHETLWIGERYAEATQRYKGGQMDIFQDILDRDKERTEKTLANDTDAYNALQALSILTKGCQACATDLECWHRRGCMFGCEVKTRSTATCIKCGTPAKRVAKNGVLGWKQQCKCSL